MDVNVRVDACEAEVEVRGSLEDVKAAALLVQEQTGYIHASYEDFVHRVDEDRNLVGGEVRLVQGEVYRALWVWMGSRPGIAGRARCIAELLRQVGSAQAAS